MAAGPWFRAGRGWYMTNEDGRQVPLGVKAPGDEAAAWAAFQALLNTVKGEGGKPDSRTVRAVVTDFLLDREGKIAPDTLRGYARQLRPLLAQFGTEGITSLDPEKVAKHAKGKAWSDTTRANYLATVELVLRFAGRAYRFDKPPKASAGADSVIPPEVYERVLLVCVGDWRQVVRFLWLTGCRPGEAASITAEMVDWSAGVVRFRHHKTARKGKQRLVYLSPEAAAVLREQKEKHGGGLLFRGKGGKPFSRAAFTMKFQRISERVGRRVTSYGFRHSYATRALAAGESDATVAALLGHAGTQMLFKHYSHLTEQARVMKAAAARLNPPAA